MVRHVLLLSLVAACAGNDAPDGAVSECTIETVWMGGVVSRTTTWLDNNGHTIRAEAFFHDEGTDIYTMQYDAEGRLASLTYQPAGYTDGNTATYSYDANHIDVKGMGDYTYDFVDGRLVHFEGPYTYSPDERTVTDYQYDASGRLISLASTGQIPNAQRSAQYTYDDQGRVSLVTYSPTGSNVITYTKSGTRTDIHASTLLNTATYEADANGRLLLSAMDYAPPEGDTYTYRYLVNSPVIEATGIGGTNTGVVTTATGTCEAPSVSLVPRLPYPLTWENAPFSRFIYPARLPNPAESVMSSLFQRY